MKQEFLWGAASSAYQIEGAYLEDGKGLSIWDVFANTPGNTKDNTNGNIACDFYHRLEEDVALMKECHLKCYRFSLSWTRILPNGRKEVNKQGIAYYQSLCKLLKEAGIEPIVTIYHWDLPQNLEDEYGGWLSEKIVDDFVHYAQVCFEALQDYVNYWIVINEPNIFTEHGYLRAVHPPKMKDMNAYLKSYHHTVIATAATVHLFKLYNYPGKIGTSLAYMPGKSMPQYDSAKNLYQITQLDWFFDPLFLGEYPKEAMEYYGQHLKDIDLYKHQQLMKSAAQEIDFIGVNYYQSTWVISAESGFELISNPSLPKTSYGWTIDPDGLMQTLTALHEKYHKPIMITENGYGGKDILINHMVHDDERIDYLREHIEMMEKAYKTGIDIIGYCCWSFTDLLSWLNGYEKRYGLVYIDFNDSALPRVRKDSFFWYKQLIIQGEKQ